MKAIEFITTPDGKVLYKEDGHEVQRLTKFSEVMKPLASIIKERFPECHARLATLYRGDSARMIDRFVRCNFGEHDLLTEDIDNGLLNFEEVRCPLRGICTDEHIICKPKSIVNLPPSEREVVNLYLNGYTIDDIAVELGKNRSTVKALLFKVKNRLAVKNCREIIKVLRMKGW